jgi:hypothetical protein
VADGGQGELETEDEDEGLPEGSPEAALAGALH